MNPAVRVCILNRDECIYEDDCGSDANNLEDLITRLKQVQRKINVFLTDFIQKGENTASQSDNSYTLDSSSDSDAEDNVKSKTRKRKLTDELE